jgi:hypothetical protein
MESLLIVETDSTPKINFDIHSRVFEISGCSLPEDASSFYRPVLTWLAEYSESQTESLEVKCRLDYFNTSSSKLILDLFRAIDKISKNGTTAKVTWYYEDDDEDMQEAGETYAQIFPGVPFEYEPYKHIPKSKLR